MFHEADHEVIQMFLCAENAALLELPSTDLVEGFVYLMAAYYVFNVQYPNNSKAILYFLQDVLMERPDKNSAAKHRPVRYASFLSKTGL